MNKIRQNFGLKLKKLRRNRKLTQEQLAEKIGINQRQLTRIETGRSFPSFATLDLLCIALNVEPISLFDFDNYFEFICNGTDGILHYNAKMLNDTIYLNANKDSHKHSNNNFDKEIGAEHDILQIAKTTKKTLKIDFYENNGYSHTILYYPDGEIEHLNNQENLTVTDIISKIKDGIYKYENSIQKLKFIELAIKSLEDKNSAEKLKLILEGMLM